MKTAAELNAEFAEYNRSGRTSFWGEELSEAEALRRQERSEAAQAQEFMADSARTRYSAGGNSRKSG
jgi:hypothetical protein